MALEIPHPRFDADEARHEIESYKKVAEIQLDGFHFFSANSDGEPLVPYFLPTWLSEEDKAIMLTGVRSHLEKLLSIEIAWVHLTPEDATEESSKLEAMIKEVA